MEKSSVDWIVIDFFMRFRLFGKTSLQNRHSLAFQSAFGQFSLSCTIRRNGCPKAILSMTVTSLVRNDGQIYYFKPNRSDFWLWNDDSKINLEERWSKWKFRKIEKREFTVNWERTESNNRTFVTISTSKPNSLEAAFPRTDQIPDTSDIRPIRSQFNFCDRAMIKFEKFASENPPMTITVWKYSGFIELAKKIDLTGFFRSTRVISI
jgi:hypothetical protein